LSAALEPEAAVIRSGGGGADGDIAGAAVAGVEQLGLSPLSDRQDDNHPLKADSSHICISLSRDFSFSPLVPHTSSQTFLRELDKKLWAAADKLPVHAGGLKELRRLAHPYKITSTGKLIDLIATIPFLLTNEFAIFVSLEQSIKANLKRLGYAL
jgi:hypothetical protein